MWFFYFRLQAGSQHDPGVHMYWWHQAAVQRGRVIGGAVWSLQPGQYSHTLFTPSGLASHGVSSMPRGLKHTRQILPKWHYCCSLKGFWKFWHDIFKTHWATVPNSMNPGPVNEDVTHYWSLARETWGSGEETGHWCVVYCKQHNAATRSNVHLLTIFKVSTCIDIYIKNETSVCCSHITGPRVLVCHCLDVHRHPSGTKVNTLYWVTVTPLASITHVMTVTCCILFQIVSVLKVVYIYVIKYN